MALLTTEAAGELLTISPRVIRSLIKRGKLPAVRIGREYRLEMNDIEKFISANKNIPEESPCQKQ